MQPLACRCLKPCLYLKRLSSVCYIAVTIQLRNVVSAGHGGSVSFPPRISLVYMANLVLCCLALLLATSLCNNQAVAKKVHISDDLEDVVDNEEDEEWHAWGKPKPKPPPPFDPPPDMTDMPPEQIQEEMIKRTSGPSIAFVKLRLDVERDREEVTGVAKKWSQLLKTGSILAKIYAIDTNTLMLVIPDGQDSLEVKDFILNQDEAYEFKLGHQAFRRPGDPSLEEVIEQLQKEKDAKEAAGEPKEPKQEATEPRKADAEPLEAAPGLKVEVVDGETIPKPSRWLHEEKPAVELKDEL